MALTPVKFGIAFTTVSMNQAGALVHIYTDGSVHLNHGGTEMGQGLMSKWRRWWPRSWSSARAGAHHRDLDRQGTGQRPPRAAPTSTARRRARRAAY